MAKDAVARLTTHLISRVVGQAASLPLPVPINRMLLRPFGNMYGVNWEELDKPLAEYRSFQQFFTRQLPKDARPISKGAGQLVSPVDGAVHSLVDIKEQRLYQIKGREYSLGEFLGPWEGAANGLEGGQAATFYLRPKDYHHVHVPADCELEACCYVPGTLWPVNPWANRSVQNLYSRNERMGFRLRSNFGVWYLFMVGALCVGGMKSVLADRPRKNLLEVPDKKIRLKAGDEIGQFLFGSTVVLLFGADCRMMFAVETEQEIRLGIPLATLQKETA